MLILAFKNNEGVTFKHPEGSVHMTLQGKIHKTRDIVVKLESDADASLHTRDVNCTLKPQEERVAIIPEKGNLMLSFPGEKNLKVAISKTRGAHTMLAFEAPLDIKITRDNAKVKNVP